MDRQQTDSLADDKAKKRWMLINAMRIAGVVMILLGLAILNDAVDLPTIAAYLLIGLGMVETFITPQILARMWRSRDDGLIGERSDLEK